MAIHPDLPTTTRRTKIVCTLGPATRSREMVRELVLAGLNVARINCSHGTHEGHAEAIENVRAVAGELGVRIPVLLDLSGPKMRIGEIEGGSVNLAVGDEFTLTTREGDARGVSINYPALVSDVGPGERILMGDGEIELRVLEASDDSLRCEVESGGELKSHQGINAPGAKLRERVPTQKDVADAEFGIAHGVDWFAMSFVRSADEVSVLRSIIARAGADTPVVAKVEKREALDGIDDILEVADALMVARGDLGLDLPIEDVPLAQKDVIAAALRAGKPVITATQMLESMIANPRPTRAEAADVANAVFDGTDAVMLSGETAVGRHPVRTVRTMARIAEASERRIDYAARFSARALRRDERIAEAVSHAACHTAIETGARVIVCCTRSGQTARYVSNYRPEAKIAVVSPYEETLRRAMLYWNTHPIRTDVLTDTDAMIAAAKRAVLDAGIAAAGDRVVVVAGVPVNVPGTTNMIKVDRL